MALRWTRCAHLLLLSLALSRSAWAAPPEFGPGPEHGKIATSDASPVDAGALEVEASYAPCWALRGGGTFDRSEPANTHVLGLAATYGLAGDVDLSVAVGYASAYDAAYDHDADDGLGPGSAHGTGFTDAVGRARWRFLRSERGLDVALVGELVLPTGAPAAKRRLGFTQGYWSTGGALVASGDLGALTANLELGMSLPAGDHRNGDRSLWFANLAGGWQVLPWLQPELELNYETSVYSQDPRAETLFVTGGFIAPFGNGYRIMAGIQCAAWGSHTGQELSATVAFKWAY